MFAFIEDSATRHLARYNITLCVYVLIFTLLFPPTIAFVHATVLGCQKLSNCNEHGTCNYSHGECVCDNGWGSPEDVNILGFIPSPDCSLRVCPSGKAWADLPSSDSEAHRIAECSNMGVCDRKTGTCSCYKGFQGKACDRTICPGNGNCSGHGKCVSMRIMSTMVDGLPLSTSTSAYSGHLESKTWDQDRIFGCLCDSSWKVGVALGETQTGPEWFGPDCSFSK